MRPCARRRSSILLLGVLLVSCNSTEPTAPPEDQTHLLDSRTHRRTDGIWNTTGGTVEAVDIDYRFISALRRDSKTQVDGSYRITWVNRTTRRLDIDFDLQFVDAGGLEVGRYDPGAGAELTLGAGNRRETTASLSFQVPHVERANEVALMRILATFAQAQD